MKSESPPENTLPATNKVFKAAYDSLQSLRGKYKWLTNDEDVRAVKNSWTCPTKLLLRVSNMPELIVQRGINRDNFK